MGKDNTPLYRRRPLVFLMIDEFRPENGVLSDPGTATSWLFSGLADLGGSTTPPPAPALHYDPPLNFG